MHELPGGGSIGDEKRGDLMAGFTKAPFHDAVYEKCGIAKGVVLLSRAAAQPRVEYVSGLLKDLVAGIAKGGGGLGGLTCDIEIGEELCAYGGELGLGGLGARVVVVVVVVICGDVFHFPTTSAGFDSGAARREQCSVFCVLCSSLRVFALVT